MNGSGKTQVSVFGSDRAPTLYFDGVHALGEFNESYQLEMFTIVNIATEPDGVIRRRKAEAFLRCTKAGLLQLMACAQAALAMGEKAAKERAEAAEAQAADKLADAMRPKPGRGKKTVLHQ